jgi:hypothetical protein
LGGWLLKMEFRNGEGGGEASKRYEGAIGCEVSSLQCLVFGPGF